MTIIYFSAVLLHLLPSSHIIGSIYLFKLLSVEWAKGLVLLTQIKLCRSTVPKKKGSRNS